MSKLNIVKHFKLEKDAIYVVKLNKEPNIEQVRQLQQQFEGIFKDTGVRFIMFGDSMDLISAPADLFDQPVFKEAIVKTLKSVGYDVSPRISLV